MSIILPVDDRNLPFVTIIIPAFNEGVQVLHTVRSIMSSRYPQEKMQVICVDDGSQDDTWSWMVEAEREFGRRVELIRQPVNRGKRHALLTAFRRAEGEIYITIDSDSKVLPNTSRHLVRPDSPPINGSALLPAMSGCSIWPMAPSRR